MDTTERLAIIEEIRRLKARYFRCVDGKDWDGFHAVFAPEMVFDRTRAHTVQDPFTGEWSPPLPPETQLVEGREAVIALVRRAVGDILTVHHGHMPEIDVLDADRAQGVWAMSDELRDRQNRLILAGRGHYHETYRHTEDGWRIASSRLTRISLVYGDGQRP